MAALLRTVAPIHPSNAPEMLEAMWTALRPSLVAAAELEARRWDRRRYAPRALKYPSRRPAW